MSYLKILLLLALCNCAHEAAAQETANVFPADKSESDSLHEVIQPAVTDTFLLGDVNNDKIADTAFVFTPPTIAALDEQGDIVYAFGCKDADCYNQVTFSAGLPAFRFEESVWGLVENAGDLDQDGYCELLFCPGWFIGSIGSLYLYSLKNGEWKQITRVSIWLEDETALKDLVIQKKHKCYLKGFRFLDGEKTPYQVEIKL